MISRPLTLGARYLFPVEGPPISNGRITIQGGRISGIHANQHEGPSPDLDLGNVAITPGFVNAHTHLELSAIDDTEPAGILDEIQWLRQVVDQRRGASEADLQEAVARHLEALLQAGTTLVADTTTAGLSWDQIAKAPLRGVVFAELIGLKRIRGLETSQHAWDWIASIGPEDQVKANARPGLSPHAPYSTSGWLYHRAAASRLPLSTHLAEMPEELELLRDREGPLREFLQDLGAWDDTWEPLSSRPADYVRRGDLRQADWLIAHGNYLDPSDFWQLRPEAAPESYRVAVAYCPRTHARFGHARHPFREMLQRGVVVCLGTDSLASAPSLSLLDEMRFLHQADETLNGALLLTMGTLFGAWALKADAITGSLRAGKSADLAVIPLPDLAEPDPYRLLLESELPVFATMFEGDFVHGPDSLLRLD